MTKEQEEAISRLRKITNRQILYGNKFGITIEGFKELQEDLETVLNMLKENSAEIQQKNTELAEKNAEIEKYKKLLADNLAKNLNDSIKAKEKANTDLEFLNLGWKIELEKKDKIIDLILDKLNQGRNVFENSEIKEIIEIYEEIKSTSDLRGIELRKNCIKQYFERKYKSRSNRKHIRQSRIVRR